MVHKTQNIIAIAEDSPTQAEELRYILEKNGYRVFQGQNGREVLNHVREYRPLLVISDILMPVMDGYELCKQIKARDDLSKIPVILLTTLSNAEDILKGLECGADSYVMKPFSEEHLLSRIHSVLTCKPAVDDETMKQRNIDVLFEGKKYLVSSTRLQILNMLLSTYEGAVQKTQKLIETQELLGNLKASLEKKVEENTEDLRMEILEREQVENAISISEKKYRNLVENALVGVFSATLEGKLLFVNEAFRTILHYDSAEKIISQPFHSLFKSPGDYVTFLNILRDSNQVRNYETEMTTGQDQTKWVIINALLKNNMLSGMILDIMERKKAEVQEMEYREKLTIAKEKAEESDRLKSSFLANMSHEIRTPMNAIIGFSSLLADQGISSENRKEFVLRISESCYSLLNLIENIIDVSKLEAGKLKIIERKCYLNRLLIDMYAIFYKEKKIATSPLLKFTLRTANEDKSFGITTDPVRLQQVLSNLLDNAFKFTEKGSISFGYTIQDNSLQFFVQDTGMGVPDDQKAFIFDSFRKAADIKTKLYGGAGLGLAICKKLIGLMGGNIWLESVKDKDTVFYFTIPLKIIEKPGTYSEETISVNEGDILKDKKILIAEDNLSNYKLLEAILAKTGANLFWAKDGIEAVNLFNSDVVFDLILMDLLMPKMDGFQATREIRQTGKEVPIVAVTAYTMGNEMEIAFKIGFNDYLTKPINPVKLVSTVVKHIHVNPH